MILEFNTVNKGRFTVILFLIATIFVFVGGYISFALDNIWVGLILLPISFAIAAFIAHQFSRGRGTIDLTDSSSIKIDHRKIPHQTIIGWYLNTKAVSISSIRLFLADGSVISIDGPILGNEGIHFEKCSLELFAFLDSVAINRLELLGLRQ